MEHRSVYFNAFEERKAVSVLSPHVTRTVVLPEAANWKCCLYAAERLGWVRERERRIAAQAPNPRLSRPEIVRELQRTDTQPSYAAELLYMRRVLGAKLSETPEQTADRVAGEVRRSRKSIEDLEDEIARLRSIINNNQGVCRRYSRELRNWERKYERVRRALDPTGALDEGTYTLEQVAAMIFAALGAYQTDGACAKPIRAMYRAAEEVAQRNREEQGTQEGGRK